MSSNYVIMSMSSLDGLIRFSLGGFIHATSICIDDAKCNKRELVPRESCVKKKKKKQHVSNLFQILTVLVCCWPAQQQVFLLFLLVMTQNGHDAKLQLEWLIRQDI